MSETREKIKEYFSTFLDAYKIQRRYLDKDDNYRKDGDNFIDWYVVSSGYFNLSEFIWQMEISDQTLRYLDGKEVEKPDINNPNWVHNGYQIALDNWNKALTPSQEIERLRDQLLEGQALQGQMELGVDTLKERIKELEEEKEIVLKQNDAWDIQVQELKEEVDRLESVIKGNLSLMSVKMPEGWRSPTDEEMSKIIGKYKATPTLTEQLQASQASEKKLREGIEKVKQKVYDADPTLNDNIVKILFSMCEQLLKD